MYCVYVLCVCIVCMYCVYVLCVCIVCMYCVSLRKTKRLCIMQLCDIHQKQSPFRHTYTNCTKKKMICILYDYLILTITAHSSTNTQS
jgi:hypothetical protein